MTDDFSKYPKSLSEIKADKENNAALQSPRDVLIQVLRDIDSGEISPVSLVVIGMQETPNHGTRSYWYNAGRNIHETLGMCAYLIGSIIK